jgi:hypothetical protein
MKLTGKNVVRAKRAQAALEHHWKQVGNLGDWESDPETAVADLLCDLMHLCRREELDFDLICEAQKGNNQYETAHPDE